MKSIFRRLVAIGLGTSSLATPTFAASDPIDPRVRIRDPERGLYETLGSCEEHGGRQVGSRTITVTAQNRGEFVRPGETTVSTSTEVHPVCFIPGYAQEEAACQRQGPKMHYDVYLKKCEEGCFLTTACVGFVGLDDDCFELRALRTFRDNILAHMPGGRRDIETYYRVAPLIVEKIQGSPAGGRELRRIYVRYILPSALAATLRRDRLAKRIYTRMLEDVSSRTGVPLRTAAKAEQSGHSPAEP